MKRILYFALAVAGFVSCAQEEQVTPSQKMHHPTFVATLESQADSRAYVAKDYKIYWSENDEIAIIDGTEPKYYRFQGEEGATSGVFAYDYGSTAASELNQTYALYPSGLYSDRFNLALSDLQQGQMPVNIWADLTGSSDNSIAGGKRIPMAAVTLANEGNKLQFKNLCGFILLKLTGNGEKISYVEIMDNEISSNRALSGDFTLKIAAGQDPVLTPVNYMGNPNIAADVYGVVLSNEITELLVPIPPMTFPKGFTVTVYGEYDNPNVCDGGIFRQTTSKPITIERNVITPMAPIEVTLTDNHPYVVDNCYISAEAQNFTFDVTCDYGDNEFQTTACVLDGTDWLTLVEQNGNTYTYSAKVNTTGEIRIGRIGIKDANGYVAQLINVAQSATSFDGFSIVGKWKYTGARYEDYIYGNCEIEEEYNADGAEEYLVLNADGSGYWMYSSENDELHSGGEFPYTFTNGVLVRTDEYDGVITRLVELTSSGIALVRTYGGDDWNPVTNQCWYHGLQWDTYERVVE